MPSKHKKTTLYLTEDEERAFRKVQGPLSLSNFLRQKLGLKPFRVGAPKGKRPDKSKDWERDDYSQA